MKKDQIKMGSVVLFYAEAIFSPTLYIRDWQRSPISFIISLLERNRPKYPEK